jgi:glucose-6-phosphate-specific signal transduction histidine kinase
VGKKYKLLSVAQISLCSVVLSVEKNSTAVFIIVSISVTPGIVLNVRRQWYKNAIAEKWCVTFRVPRSLQLQNTFPVMECVKKNCPVGTMFAV